MSRILILAAAALAVAGPAMAAEKSRDNVYALCTVRDVTVKDNRMVGRIYRSSVFSAPASYDEDISMSPEHGGKVSKSFEAWLWKNRGFRPDRQSISKGDENYCIEAPVSLEGKAKLEAMRHDWDRTKFPSVDLVATDWAPPRSEADKRYDADLADYEAKAQAVRDAEDKYKRDMAAMEEAKARNAAASQAALDQFAKEHAAYEAAAAESERQRQAYREEYKRVTGHYPDGGN